MNVLPSKILIGGTSFLLGLSMGALSIDLEKPDPEKVYLPSPVVTEYKPMKVPVPGPTVTKKVPGPTKTIRVQVKEASRSTSRPRIPKAVSNGSARDIARQIFGSQFSCADALISKESGWRVNATNPSSGAYGLPQSLPGSKMASAGADWRTNPATQLRWMKSYVDSRYDGICGAWSHSQTHNWY